MIRQNEEEFCSYNAADVVGGEFYMNQGYHDNQIYLLESRTFWFEDTVFFSVGFTLFVVRVNDTMGEEI